jgi:hypothetical protein
MVVSRFETSDQAWDGLSWEDGASLCPERATIRATARVDGIARLCVLRPQLRIFFEKKNRTMQLSPYLSPPLY